jgi:hypothetical protein
MGVGIGLSCLDCFGAARLAMTGGGGGVGMCRIAMSGLLRRFAPRNDGSAQVACRCPVRRWRAGTRGRMPLGFRGKAVPKAQPLARKERTTR